MKRKLTIFFIAALLLSSAGTSQVIKGTYAIKNVQTGMVLRIKDANKTDNTPLVAYIPVNWKCVTWNFNHVEGQTYLLENLFTGKTFQTTNEKPEAGNALKQRPVKNTTIQQYEFIPIAKDVYLIRLKGTDLYITPTDEKGTVNSSIILSKKDGSKLQQWIIYEQHPDI